MHLCWENALDIKLLGAGTSLKWILLEFPSLLLGKEKNVNHLLYPSFLPSCSPSGAVTFVPWSTYQPETGTVNQVRHCLKHSVCFLKKYTCAKMPSLCFTDFYNLRSSFRRISIMFVYPHVTRNQTWFFFLSSHFIIRGLVGFLNSLKKLISRYLATFVKLYMWWLARRQFICYTDFF